MTAKYSFAAAAACLAVLAAAGCASLSSQGSGRPGAVVVTGKDALYIAPPTVPDTLDTLLAGFGWGNGRMSRELHKEIIYQFNRKGVATVEDSASAKAVLTLVLSEYVQGGGAASRYSIDALLRIDGAERRIAMRKAPKGAESPERDDPALDNIRTIAATVVEESRKDPKAKQKPKTVEYVPNMIMIF